jgi:putative oxidoreductase
MERAGFAALLCWNDVRVPLIRAMARPLLASIFVVGGIDAFRNAHTKAAAAQKVLAPMSRGRIDTVSDAELAVKVDGAVKVAAGLSLASGRFPRLSALVLAATLVPTTLAGHRFWEESDKAARAAQRLQFTKNASILGGLILAVVDTEGRPSLGWRARRASGALVDAATDLRHETEHALHAAADAVREKLPS